MTRLRQPSLDDFPSPPLPRRAPSSSLSRGLSLLLAPCLPGLGCAVVGHLLLTRSLAGWLDAWLVLMRGGLRTASKLCRAVKKDGTI